MLSVCLDSRIRTISLSGADSYRFTGNISPRIIYSEASSSGGSQALSLPEPLQEPDLQLKPPYQRLKVKIVVIEEFGVVVMCASTFCQTYERIILQFFQMNYFVIRLTVFWTCNKYIME